MKYQIDDIDRKILSYLVKNARVPFLEIARECGISGAAIHQRVKKMEDAGIIEGSRFIVKPRALGFKICAFIGVILDNASQYKKVVKEIEKIPEVIECHFITGHYSFFLKIRYNIRENGGVFCVERSIRRDAAEGAVGAGAAAGGRTGPGALWGADL